MQGEDQICASDDIVEQSIRDALRWTTVGFAREGSVEVEAIQRTSTLVGDERGWVRHRNEDDSTIEQRRITRQPKIEKRQHALAFVAMDSRQSHEARPRPCADRHLDRDAHG
jgi:hypothetical protein